MKKLSLLITASAMLVAGLSLTSCSGNSVANAGEAFAMKTLQDLKDNSSAEKKLEVTFWHSFGDTIERPLNDLIDSFEETMEETSGSILVSLV